MIDITPRDATSNQFRLKNGGKKGEKKRERKRGGSSNQQVQRYSWISAPSSISDVHQRNIRSRRIQRRFMRSSGESPSFPAFILSSFVGTGDGGGDGRAGEGGESMLWFRSRDEISKGVCFIRGPPHIFNIPFVSRFARSSDPSCALSAPLPTPRE